MPKPKFDSGPTIVDIHARDDGTVCLVFSHPIPRFTASADEMAQLGMNLIKAAAVAALQHPQFEKAQKTPLRKM